MGEFIDAMINATGYQLDADDLQRLLDLYHEYETGSIYQTGTWLLLDLDDTPPYMENIKEFDTSKQAEIAFHAYEEMWKKIGAWWAMEAYPLRQQLDELWGKFAAEYLEQHTQTGG